MTRRLAVAIVGGTQADRKFDENVLLTHARNLRRGARITAAQRKATAAAIDRFVRDDYPANRRERAGASYRNALVAELLGIAREVEGDPCAENTVASFCRKHGIALTAQAVDRLGRSATSRRAIESVATRIAGALERYPDVDVVAAHRAGIEAAIARAGAGDKAKRRKIT